MMLKIVIKLTYLSETTALISKLISMLNYLYIVHCIMYVFGGKSCGFRNH